jgi:hypothetical protein
MNLIFPHGNFIIPADEVIFFRGVGTTIQLFFGGDWQLCNVMHVCFWLTVGWRSLIFVNPARPQISSEELIPSPLWQAPPWGPKNGKIRNEQFRCSNYKLINWLNSKNMKSWTTQCPCSRTPSRSVGPLPVAVCSCSNVIVLSP